MRIKHLLILAATAGMALSCATNFEATPTQEAEIGFGTWAEHLTKARTQGGNAFTDGDKFFVYGYKTINDANTPVFQGVEVTATDYANQVWTYSPKKFWDKNATSYTFFAVSRVENTDPTADDSKEASVTTGALNSQTITFAGNQNDILVAAKRTVAKTEASNTFNNYTANLDFHHIASLVDFKVKKAPTLVANSPASITVAITDVKLEDINYSGTYTISYNAETKLPIPAWSAWTSGTAKKYVYKKEGDPETPVDGSVYFPSGMASLPTNVNVSSCDPDDQDETHTNGDALISGMVMMPQNLTNGQKLLISYTITINDGTVTDVITIIDAPVVLQDFDNTDFDQATENDNTDTHITSWEAGKHYTYYLTIDAHAIEFSASITPWTTMNAYYYLVD